jgi:hypothetical protein
VVCAREDASVPWISVACAVVGSGLGFVGLSQVLAIQHTTEEGVRGVATSLVPFFRAVGGALGVGALGGLLSLGLFRRLGRQAEGAGRLLAGASGETAEGLGLAPAEMRQALEQALLPVFVVLLLLALVNLYVVGFFPLRADEGPGPRA